MGLYRQAGREIMARPGDLVLLRPDALHDYSVPAGGYWEFLWAHFQPRVSWYEWWQWSEVVQGLFKTHLRSPGTFERVYQTFLKLHTDASTLALQRPSSEQAPSSALQKELALNGLEEIFLLAAREHMQEGETLDPRIQHILSIMAQDLSAPHSLDSLARVVALSPSRLAHLFKQEVGDSLTNVLLTLRLNNAARLLEFSDYSVGRIADTTGFNSAFYFSRQFHRRFGSSPRAYRAARGAGPSKMSKLT